MGFLYYIFPIIFVDFLSHLRKGEDLFVVVLGIFCVVVVVVVLFGITS